MRIGIDLGGTKIEGVVIDADGQVRERTRVPTPRGSYEGTLAAVAELVARLEGNIGACCRVGIGMPGAVSPATGLIKNANSVWLNGKPFVRDIERSLKRPVRVANDADCFTLSEATDGAGAGLETVFGVILGTGVGGGVAIGGRTLVGANAIAGEGNLSADHLGFLAQISAVPEPATVALVAVVTLGVGGALWQRRRRHARSLEQAIR